MDRVVVMTWGTPEAGKKTPRFDRCNGTLLAIGTDFDQIDGGIAQYPVGIIALDDGYIEAVPLPLLRFARYDKSGQ